MVCRLQHYKHLFGLSPAACKCSSRPIVWANIGDFYLASCVVFFLADPLLDDHWLGKQEWSHWRAMEMTKGLVHLSCEERFMELGLLSLQKGWLQGILSVIIRGCKEDGAVVPSDRPRSKGNKLKFHLQLNPLLPCNMVGWRSPSLEVCKTSPDIGLRNLLQPALLWLKLLRMTLITFAMIWNSKKIQKTSNFISSMYTACCPNFAKHGGEDLGGAVEVTLFVQPGRDWEETSWQLQIPYKEELRGRHLSVLCGDQCQDLRKWHEAESG